MPWLASRRGWLGAGWAELLCSYVKLDSGNPHLLKEDDREYLQNSRKWHDKYTKLNWLADSLSDPSNVATEGKFLTI